MSKVYDRYRVPGEPDVWYLKLSDGSVYGPEEHSVVFRWASEGRIAPGDQISQDNITWVFAENVARMRMDWMAEMGNGKTYGPFNLLAVPNLVRHGTFRPTARLVNRYTGKSLRVEDVLKSDVATELAVQDDVVAVLDNSPAVAGPLPPVQAQPKQNENATHHKDGRHKTHSDVDHRLEELQKRFATAETELAAHKLELDEERRKREALGDSIKHLEKEKESAVKQIGELKAELEEEKSLHTTVRTSSGEKEKDLVDRIEVFTSNANKMKVTLQEAQQQLAEQRQKNLDIEKQKLRVEQELGQRIEQLSSHVQATKKLDAEVRDLKAQLGKSAELLQNVRQEMRKDRQDLLEASRKKENELQTHLGEKTNAVDQLRQEIEQLINKVQSAQAAQKRVENELSEKTIRHDSLTKESTAKEQTLLRQIEEFRKQLQNKTDLLDKEQRLRSDADAQRDETAKKRDAETHDLKAQLDKSTELLQSVRQELQEAKQNLEAKQRELQHLVESNNRKAKELQTSLGEKASAIDRLKQEMEQLINQLHATQSVQKRVENELNEKTVRYDSLAKESTAKEQTLGRQIEELHKEVENKTGLLEKEQRLRNEANGQHKETTQKLDGELQSRKAQLDKLANLLETARQELKKEKASHVETEKTSKDRLGELEKEIQVLTLQVTVSSKYAADVQIQLNKEKEDRKSLHESSQAEQKELQNALNEKSKVVEQMEQSNLKERKEQGDTIHSIRLAEEELQRDVDEKTGLLERIKRELEKEKTWRADAEAKNKEAGNNAESEIRTLNAQIAGLAKFLEATKLELYSERGEHTAFVKSIAEKEKALRDQIRSGSIEHIASLEGEIADLKAKADETAGLVEKARTELENERGKRETAAAEMAARVTQLEQELKTSATRNKELTDELVKNKELPSIQEEFTREKESLLKQVKELEGRRNHAEILVQETLSELNKHKERQNVIAQEAQARQLALEKRIKELEEAAPPAKWYLKMTDGSVYGPAEMPELRDWADQCRVVPGNELSQDRQKWIPAESIPELKMNWLIELLDKSTYGPLTDIALGELVRDGLAAPDAKVTNRITNEQTFLDKLQRRIQPRQT